MSHPFTSCYIYLMLLLRYQVPILSCLICIYIDEDYHAVTAEKKFSLYIKNNKH